MTTQVTEQPDTTGLMDEVRRYLIAVEAFRAEGHQPCWWPERNVPTGRSRPRRARLDRG